MSEPIFNEHSTASDVLSHFKDEASGKTYVITGPSAGSLGASVALSLAQGSPRQIILLGRNPAVITPLISEIKAVCPSTDVVFIQLDLGDLQSVRDAVPQIKAALSSLSSDSSHASVGIDCLINCAGVLAPKNYSLSKDGIELQFAVNHLGHFLLTNLLIDDVKRVGGIVINVSSGGHFLFDSDYDNYNMDNGKTYSRWLAYAKSKAANIHFSVALAKRGVTTLAPTPGTMNETPLRAKQDVTDDVFVEAFELAQKSGRDAMAHAYMATLDEGTAALLIAILDKRLREHSGSYMYMTKLGGGEPFTTDADLAEKLWSVSEQLVGQKFAF